MAFTPTYYPVPNANETRDLLGITQFVNNSLSDGLFFPLMILVIWFVQFISVVSAGRGASRAWIISSFVATILAIIGGILALVEQRYVYLLVLLCSFGLFWYKMSTSQST